jgi:hypothetical protein
MSLDLYAEICKKHFGTLRPWRFACQHAQAFKAFASQHFSTVAAPPFQQVSIAR